MFSARTNWTNEPNRLSELRDSLLRDGKPLLDLTESNPTACNIIYPEREILQAFQTPEVLRYHPHPQGLLSAREAIARYYLELGATVDPQNIFLQASTSEGYATAFKTLCDPGDTVLIPQPSYPLFEYLAELNDIVLAPYPLRYDGEWHIDLAALNTAITLATRAIIIINPHNPTGMFLKQREMDALNVIAREHDLALIVDEVFIDYWFAADRHRASPTVTNDDALTFTLNGISKTLGLPQMKLGWIVVSGPAALAEAALQRLEMVCDTYLSVNTPVQAALPELFEACKSVREQIRNRTQENFRTLRETLLPPSPCSFLDSEGGWYGLISVPRLKSDEDWCIELLDRKGVLVYPGYYFDIEEEGRLVVSLLTEEEKFKEGMSLITEYVGGK